MNHAGEFALYWICVSSALQARDHTIRGLLKKDTGYYLSSMTDFLCKMAKTYTASLSRVNMKKTCVPERNTAFNSLIFKKWDVYLRFFAHLWDKRARFLFNLTKKVTCIQYRRAKIIFRGKTRICKILPTLWRQIYSQILLWILLSVFPRKRPKGEAKSSYG